MDLMRSTISCANAADFIDEWRGYQKSVVALEDVAVVETERGTRVGVYVGADGDRPTRSMDALAHELVVVRTREHALFRKRIGRQRDLHGRDGLGNLLADEWRKLAAA